MLAQLHEGHSGMALAHMYVWWSGITGDSECAVSDCAECQCNQPQPAVALLCLQCTLGHVCILIMRVQ